MKILKHGERMPEFGIRRIEDGGWMVSLTLRLPFKLCLFAPPHDFWEYGWGCFRLYIGWRSMVAGGYVIFRPFFDVRGKDIIAMRALT